MESVLSRFSTAQVVLIALVVVLGLALIWGLAHWTAAPGTIVNVGWISYTKPAAIQPLKVTSEAAEEIPDVRLEPESSGDPEDLRRKIEELEGELQKAYDLQSRQQIETLDPQSELPQLISELDSDDSVVREEAVAGLFVLRNPVSFQPLKDHFVRGLPEAGYFVSEKPIERWFELLFLLDEMESVKLAAKVAGSTELSDDARREARSALMFQTESVDALNVAIGVFQELALTSANTLIRTNAKKDLQWLIEKRDRIVGAVESDDS